MRDFDIERALRPKADRTFKLGGETFTRRPAVRPEAIAPWEEVGQRGAEMGNSEVLEAIDKTVLNLIEPGAKAVNHRRWEKLREREDDPVTLQDLIDLITWMVEEMAGRPTQPSGNSSEEPDGTGTESTDDSSSPDLKAA